MTLSLQNVYILFQFLFLFLFIELAFMKSNKLFITSLLIISPLPLQADEYASSIASLGSVYSMSLRELAQVTVVTAASGFEQQASDAPATVTIITNEEWQAMGATTLYEVLETVAGIHIGYNYSVAETPTIIMRGLGGDGTQVKVLIDGQSFMDSTRAEVKPAGVITLAGFKRIEVIKGPGSVIFGADAFAGIINLVSDEIGDQIANHVAIKRGSYGTKDISISHGGSQGDNNKFKWQWSAQYEEAGLTERAVEADAQTGLDLAPFSALTAPASNAPGFLQDWHNVSNVKANISYNAFSLGFFHWRLDAGIQLGITDRIDDGDKPVSGEKLEQTNVQLSYALDSLSSSIPGALTMEFLYGIETQDADFIVFPEGAVVLIGDDGNLFSANGYPTILIEDGLFTHTGFNNETVSIKLHHVFDVNENHGIRWEMGYERFDMDPEFTRMFGPGITDSITLPRPEDGSPLMLGAVGSGIDVADSPENQFIIPAERDFWFVSLLDEWRPLENLHVSLGIRYDRYSDFGNTTNPRVGVNWQVSDELQLKFFNGSAFRAPAFGELYTRNNSVGIGDKNLSPETINTSEVGFSYDAIFQGRLSLSGTLYYFETDDIIRDLPDPVTNKALYQNTKGEQGKGIELEALWKPFDELSLRLNYSNSSLKNAISNEKRMGIPDRQFYINANWRISRAFNWNLGVKSVSGRERTAGDARAPIEDYVALTTRFAWQGMVEGLTIAISGTNITDDYISEPGPQYLSRDIPMSGSMYKLELRYVY
jgi:outer membrane receptor for ferrienterochelin and colicins